MALIPNVFGSTYQQLEEANSPSTAPAAAQNFASAFAKFLASSQAGDAPAVPAALSSPAAKGPFISALVSAFKSPSAAAMAPLLDLAITAYLTTACLQGLYVSPVSGTGTAFTPVTPLVTIVVPMFQTPSSSGLEAKIRVGTALQTYLGAGQVAFPGPPPVVKPIV